MKNIAFHDNELKDIQGNNLSLSILICKGGFSFTILNQTEKKYHDFFYKNIDDKCYLKELKENIDKHELGKKEFAKVNVQIATNRCTVIPESFYVEDNYKDFFDFSFTNRENTLIRKKHLPKLNLYVLYEIDKDIENYLKQNFPGCIFTPQSASFMQSNLKKSITQENESPDKLYIQFFNDFFEIMIVREKKMLLHNTFVYNSSNDITYYILNVFNQLKLSQDKTEIIISGLIEKNDISVINLKKFVNFVYFESLSNDYKYFYKFQDISPHYFYHFLNINL